MLSIFDDNHMLMKKMLDIYAERHDVVANNIANVNTPGFKRSDLDFQSELNEAISENDDSEQLASLEGEVVKTNITPVRRDGNNVDLNKELAIMSENSILYKAYTQFLKSRLNKMREAMRGPQ